MAARHRWLSSQTPLSSLAPRVSTPLRSPCPPPDSRACPLLLFPVPLHKHRRTTHPLLKPVLFAASRATPAHSCHCPRHATTTPVRFPDHSPPRSTPPHPPYPNLPSSFTTVSSRVHRPSPRASTRPITARHARHVHPIAPHPGFNTKTREPASARGQRQPIALSPASPQRTLATPITFWHLIPCAGRLHAYADLVFDRRDWCR